MRERIVGAIVLFSAGILLWVILFPASVDDVPELDRESLIPPQMVVDKPLWIRAQKPEAEAEADSKMASAQQAAATSKPIQQAAKPDTSKARAVAAKPVSQSKASEKQSQPSKAEQAASAAKEKAALLAAKAQAESKASVESKKQTQAEKIVKPSPATIDKATGLPEAWIIQVASMKSKDNAVALTEKLQAEGFKAYYRRTESKNGSVIYRVIVGPKLSLSLAEAEKARIENDYKLKTLLMRFTR